MKVKHLLALLAKADQEAQVILRKDTEGNGHSPLADVELNAVYVPETEVSGDVYELSWSAEDAGMTKAEWAALIKKPRCVVLGPLN